MEASMVAGLAALIVILVVGMGFFFLRSEGYLIFGMNKTELRCLYPVECDDPTCYLEDCSSTQLAAASNTTLIRAMICPVCTDCEDCPEPIVCPNCTDILETDLNVTFMYQNTTSDFEFLGDGIYNGTLPDNTTITVTIVGS